MDNAKEQLLRGENISGGSWAVGNLCLKGHMIEFPIKIQQLFLVPIMCWSVNKTEALPLWNLHFN